jgi:transcription elongation GreA/GreB family factor
VVDWDLFGGKVTIDFERETGRSMGLKLALEKTQPLEADDFRAHKIEQIEELRELAQAEPAEVVLRTLQSHGGSMKPDLIDRELCGSIVPEKGYKKWWDKAKKALRDSRKVIVPSKRNEPLVVRDTDLSPVETLLADFTEARDLKAKTKVLDELQKDAKTLREDSGARDRLVSAIEEVAAKGTKLHLGNVLELLAGRDELFAAMNGVELPANAAELKNVLALATVPLAPEMSGMAAARQRRVYEAFPDAFGDRWVEMILGVFDQVGTRGVAEIAKLFAERGELDILLGHIRKALSHQILGADALGWICRERKKAASDVFGPSVGFAILSVIEQDSTDDGPRRSLRLQNLLMEDRGLVADLLEGVDLNDVRNFARKLLASPALPELDRKSLMARVIKAHPETQELVAGDTGPRKETLVVSYESLERRKEEYEDLVNSRIPQNIKDIAIARSYGDLRENFEYKAAKQMQAVLNRRKVELENDLNRAQGTDFKGADVSGVNIGTVVTLEREGGGDEQYTVLGAWDSDPEKQFVSYLSEIGQALIGRKVGDTVDFRDLETEEMHKRTITGISAYVS